MTGAAIAYGAARMLLRHAYRDARLVWWRLLGGACRTTGEALVGAAYACGARVALVERWEPKGRR